MIVGTIFFGKGSELYLLMSIIGYHQLDGKGIAMFKSSLHRLTISTLCCEIKSRTLRLFSMIKIVIYLAESEGNPSQGLHQVKTHSPYLFDLRPAARSTLLKIAGAIPFSPCASRVSWNTAIARCLIQLGYLPDTQPMHKLEALSRAGC